MMVKGGHFMFTREYWSSSARKLKETKYLAIIAMMVALKVVISGFYIPVSDNLRIMYSFFVSAAEAAIIGPVAAALSGAISDLVGFMIHPTGPFFFGYTISSMLGSFIYGIFLYKAQITILRLFCAKAAVNYLVNVLLGSVWSAMMYSKGYIYYAGKSLIKNTLLLPLEVVLLVIVFNMVIPVLQGRGLLIHQKKRPVPFK